MRKVWLSEYNNSVYVNSRSTKILAVELDHHRSALDNNGTPNNFWEFDNEYQYREFKKLQSPKERMKKIYI